MFNYSRNMNSGYSGYSMSNRAVEAYDNGFMPKSKWTKKAMLDVIRDFTPYETEDALINLLNRLTREELFDYLFEYKEWHHTSFRANRTDFYGVDVVKLAYVTDEAVEEIINNRSNRNLK